MEQQHHHPEGEARVNWTKMTASPIVLPEKTQKVFPEENFIARSEAEIFYGIALPEGEGVLSEGGKCQYCLLLMINTVIDGESNEIVYKWCIMGSHAN